MIFFYIFHGETKYIKIIFFSVLFLFPIDFRFQIDNKTIVWDLKPLKVFVYVFEYFLKELKKSFGSRL